MNSYAFCNETYTSYKESSVQKSATFKVQRVIQNMWREYLIICLPLLISTRGLGGQKQPLDPPTHLTYWYCSHTGGFG